MADVKSAQIRDMLDIIFQNRNKAYGAYQLRRDYNKYLMRAFGFGLLFLFLLFMLPRLVNAVSSALAEKPVEVEIEMSAPPDLTNEPPPPPPPPPPTPPPPTRTTVQFVPPIIKKDEEVVEEEPKKVIEELEEVKADIGKSDVKGNDEAPPETFDNPSELEVVEAPKVVEDKVYETFDIQKMPSFPGGEAELQKFLRDNINYPAIARENNIQGTAALSFVVGKDGTISNVTILKDPGGGCGKEAVRVVNSMPKWAPGEANGNPVKVKFTLPVRFRLE
jgi:periplasmic protein TonB